MSGKKVVIIGSGINGLVAANYLSKKGFSVSVIEKNNHTGGACTYKTKIIENQTIDYAYGATVLGMMPDFIFNETGLSKNVKIFAPKHPKLVYFPDSKVSTRIYQDYKKLDKEIKNKWGEKGNLESFRMDEDKVVDFIREGCRKGETPTLEKARNSLGQALTDLWIKGSAKNLLDHYFSSDKTKIYMGMTAIESGSSSIKNNGTAFTIPLMDSGSVFNGYWGYVKGGIWQISHEITKINKKIGVHFHMSSNISSIDSNKMKISFKKENKNYEIDYDYLIFATDPITPSKILKNKDLQTKIEDNDFLGTSGKITAFFKNPVIWKENSPYKNSDSAFRFIFSNQTLSDFEKSSQSVIKNSKMQHLVVFPNNDSGSKKILQEIKKTNLNYVPTLTLSEYRTLLSGKMILLGNSSSGIHEAASFKVPVINIGSRQSGRYKPINVINVNYDKKEIEKAIKKVKSQSFYKKIKNIKNPYGDGKSALKIIQIIKKLNLKNFDTQKKLTY